MNNRKKPNGRMAFTPSAKSREYFDALVKRLQKDRALDVRVTQREAFAYMVELAQAGEASHKDAGVK
jgi:hypothetical protein